VEVSYEWIQKLVHGLQVPTIDNFLNIVFRASLQSYFRNYDYKDEMVNITTT
jgi:hypothetical protein